MTDAPTKSPSNAPTVAPSESPTQHPITYSDFQYEIFAYFRITGWTDAEIADVNHGKEAFVTSMNSYIHQGFDEDDDLEYRDAILNITNITDNFYDDWNSDDHSTSNETSHVYNMDLQCLIGCRNVYVCHYISGENTTVQMDRSEFETFVTNKLNFHFSSNDSLLFTVMNMTMSIDTDKNEGIGIVEIILIICGVLCIFISGVSIGVILYHRKRQQSNHHAEPPAHEEQNPNELAVPLTPSPISAKTSGARSESCYNAEGQEGVPATGFGFAEGEGQMIYQHELHDNEEIMGVELQPIAEQNHEDSDHEDSADVLGPGKGGVE